MSNSHENETSKHCSQSIYTPVKPSSSYDKAVEDTNFVSKLKELNDMKFQRVIESRLDNKTKESGGFEGKRVA